ncbi:hypothetical protein Pla52n_31340 [Stieleria varia]|uniref:Uncharacterized protein n=1 Tax=Stieleria varia TaxID=2528005 RepID=A0A5C6AZL2_9BACT|nr:hypothetical protein Pla52n_31340 [Stieleria varia]
MRFRIRTVLSLTFVIAILLAWYLDHQRLKHQLDAANSARLEKERMLAFQESLKLSDALRAQLNAVDNCTEGKANSVGSDAYRRQQKELLKHLDDFRLAEENEQ